MQTSDEFIQRLSFASDEEILEVEKFLSADIPENGPARNFICKGITACYKAMHHSLEKAAVEFAKGIFDERQVLLEDIADYDDEGFDSNRLKANNFKQYNALRILNGTAPKIFGVVGSDFSKSAVENNNKGTQIHKVWSALKMPVQYREQQTDDIELNFSDEEAISIYTEKTESKKSSSALTGDNCEWMQYRKQIKGAMAVLAEPASEVLFKGTNAIVSNFRTAVNRVCEFFGFSPPYAAHEGQKFFKKAFEKVREEAGLDEFVPDSLPKQTR